MARYSFGGQLALGLVAPGSGVATNPLVLAPASPVSFYDAPNGVVVNDFLLYDTTSGTYPTSSASIVSTSDSNLPRFQGPDGLASLWHQAFNGTWLELPTNDMNALISAWVSTHGGVGGGAGGGVSVVDNGDGTGTLTTGTTTNAPGAGSAIVDYGDGTGTITY